MQKYIKAIIMIVVILALMVGGQVAPLAVADQRAFS